MKIAKIMGVMLIALVMQNIWAMEVEQPTIPEYLSLEQRLLAGNLSAQQYLLEIEKSSTKYSDMLATIRTGRYSLYEGLIDTIFITVNHLRGQNTQEVNKLKSLYKIARKNIQDCYDGLKSREAAGRVRYQRGT